MKHKQVWLIWSALTLACSVFGTAGDEKAVEKQLKQKLGKQVLSLRIPTVSERLHFDSTGLALGRFLPAPWTTGGLLQVQEISLKRDELRIEGERVLIALRSGKPSSSSPSLTTILTKRSVRVTVSLDATSVDASKIGAILLKIFEPVDIQRRLATYWVPVLKTGADLRSSEMGQVIGTLEGSRPVYHVKPGLVESPKPLQTPDPEYTDNARRKRLQGTAELMVVVNENGVPEILQVVKDLGEGLDIRALETVSEWRFKPAMRNGEPVAVMMNVQVMFKLF